MRLLIVVFLGMMLLPSCSALGVVEYAMQSTVTGARRDTVPPSKANGDEPPLLYEEYNTIEVMGGQKYICYYVVNRVAVTEKSLEQEELDIKRMETLLEDRRQLNLKLREKEKKKQ